MTSPASASLIPPSLAHCVCSGNNTPCLLCCGRLCFRDQGIQDILKPKPGEVAEALALDGCIFTDNKTKCDGLFLLSRSGRAYVMLVELKATHIDDAFKQLCYVINHRTEYKGIIAHLRLSMRVIEKSFIITNSFLSARDKVKLQNAYGIRPQVTTHGKPTLPPPDLRQLILS